MDLSGDDWAFVDERAEHFTGREWVFERIRSFFASDARLLVIVAPPGAGKSAIAARLAQSSAGRLPDEPGVPVPVGTLDAAVFCRAGQVSLLDVAQDLADQLATTFEGFAAEQRSTVAPSVEVSDVDVSTGDVTGSRVVGVNIDLARLGPERAFADGLSLPIRRLSEKAGFRPPVLLIDSLDEAYASPVAQKLPGLLAGMTTARLVMTTRDDPRVLAAIGLDAAVVAGRAVRIHLVTDAPADIDEVAEYAARRLHDHGPDEAIAVLARRIGAAAEGNFLYAHHVVGPLLEPSALTGLDASSVEDVPLPAGGLAGVYRDFLARELGGDEERWSREVRPILAPLAVALGDGLETTQLATIATVLAGRPVPRSIARDVTRLTGQFLNGSQPDGPYRVYHRSFTDFLIDVGQNPDWPIDPEETHGAIVESLLPRDADGNAAWSPGEPYVRTHLAEHAAACGRLDGLLTDPGFIVIADIDRLLPLLWNAASAEAREAAAVVQLASADLRGRQDDERASYLELAARMRGAEAIADGIAALMPDRAWSVPRARWRTPAPHVRLTGHRGTASAVATTVIDGRPVAVSGGYDGTVRVWDLRDLVQLGEPLDGHRGEVWTVAAGTVDGRPVAISGGWDATIRVWDLTDRVPRGEPLVGHADYVRSVALGEVDGRPLLVSAGADGIRVWDPVTLAPLGEPMSSPKGQVMEVAIGTANEETVVACAGGDGAVRAWTIGKDGTFSRRGEPMVEADGWSPQTICIAVADVDGRPVAVSGNADGNVRAWDLRAMATLREPMGGHDDRGVLAVAMGTVGDRPLVSSAARDGIRIWDLRTMVQLSGPLVGHEGGATSVAFDEVDGRPVVVSGGGDGTVRVWDLALETPQGAPDADEAGRLDGIVVSDGDDGPVAVTLGADGVRTWDTETLEPRAGPVEVGTHFDGTLAVGVVDDRRVVVAGGGSTSALQVLDFPTLARLGVLLDDQGGSGVVVATGFVENRPIAATGDRSGMMRLWDLRTLAPIGDSVQVHEEAVLAVRICKFEGRTLIVTGGDDEEIQVCDGASPELGGKPLGGRVGRVACLAVGLAEGRPLAVRGGYEGAVRVWDLQTLEPLGKPFRGHAGQVTSVALSEFDGRPIIISAGSDGSVRMWDIRSWSQVSQLSMPVLTDLAIAPPDRIVATASSGLVLIRVARLPAAPPATATRITS